MKRREFIALLGGGVATWPLAVRAQGVGIRKIGVLVVGDPDPAPFLKGIQERLRELGYVEGRDIEYEVRSAAGEAADLAPLAAELAERKVDVIVAYQTPTATAAKKATTEIPIVFEVADPVQTGLVASLSRPGGNLTGVSGATAELGAKNLEMIHEILPSARRVAIFANASDPFHVLFLDDIQAAAKSLTMDIKPVMARSGELENSFAEITSWGADAVLVQPSLPQQQIAILALKHRVPAVAPTSAFSELGGLFSYAADLNALFRRVAEFVDKVLKGSKPADLPVERPTKFLLSINLKTAKTLGITVPSTVLTRADHIIE